MKISKASDPSAIVIPFGKHKGSTIAELLARDPSYAEWVVNQGWVAERFAELHAAILSRGAQSDDSPAHNAIQVRFLDETFRLACLMAASPERLTDREKTKPITSLVLFERRGVDVFIEYEFLRLGYINGCRINVEIKPSMGDDFPSVMRQMGRTGSIVLVVGEYNGSIPEPQVRQMFAANGCAMILLRDIEAEIANARADIASHPAPAPTP